MKKKNKRKSYLSYYNPNTYDFGGSFKKAIGSFSADSLGESLGGAANGIAGLVGGAVGNYISNGLHSTAGDILNTVSNIGAAIPGPLGVAINGGGKVVGGAVNALIGTKVDQGKLDAANQQINQFKNYQGDAEEFEDVQDVGPMTSIANPFKGGLFKKNWAKSSFDALKNQLSQAYNFALRSQQNNIENIQNTQTGNLLRTSYARGGLLGNMYDGEGDRPNILQGEYSDDRQTLNWLAPTLDDVVITAQNPKYKKIYDEFEEKYNDYKRYNSDFAGNTYTSNGNYITLKTKGNMNLASIPTNVLDSIAVNTGRSKTDIKTNLGLVGKESTFGQLFNGSEPFSIPMTANAYLAAGTAKNREEAIQKALSDGKTHMYNDQKLISNWAYSNTPYDDIFNQLYISGTIDALRDGVLNEKQRQALLQLGRDMQKGALESGIKRYHENPMADGFARYAANPKGYNPGQGNYVQMVNNIANEVWNEPQIQRWWREEGRDWYNKGRNGYSLGGNLFNNGGGLHINPSKKGTFTAAASKHGMGVQEFASKVLSNKEDYSSAMVKKANFAHVFGGRNYANGGPKKKLTDDQYLSIMEKVAQDNYRNWEYNNTDEALASALNDPTYNYRAFYNSNPDAINDSETHWPDTYKTVYHPTFSNESKYSGKKDKNYNPNGILGGYWTKNPNLKGYFNEMFMPSWEQTMDKYKVEYKEGGPLNTHGGIWSNGLTFINNGGSHEENPFDGVPIGIGQDGKPNLVEEGEVIWNDYVFSNRLKAPKSLIAQLKLGTKKDITFADLAKKAQKESSERPNDPISKRGLEDTMIKLIASQEEVRQREQELEDMRNSLIQQGIAAFGGPVTHISKDSKKHAKGGKLGTLYAGPGSRSNNLVPYEPFNPYHDFNTYVDTSTLFNNREFYNPQITYTYKEPKVPEPKQLSLSDTMFNNQLKTQSTLSDLAAERDKRITLANRGNSFFGNRGNSWGTALRYAPVLGSAFGVFSDLMGWTNKPDYSNANMILDYAKNNIRDVEPALVSDYMSYRPVDRLIAANRQGLISNATDRNIMNTSSGNSGVARAALIANGLNSALADAKNIIAGEEANWGRYKDTVGHNANIDKANADTIMRSQLAGQENSKLMMDAAYRAAALRDGIDKAVSAAKSANLTNLFNNLGNLGIDIENRRDRDMLIRAGVFGTLSEKPQGWSDKEWKDYKSGIMNSYLAQSGYKKGGKLKKKKGITI